MRFSARAASGRLHIAAAAAFSPTGMTSSRNRPSPAPSDTWTAPSNRQLRTEAARGDERRSGDCSGRRHHLQAGSDLPAHGKLTVLTIVSGRIHRSQEFVQKLQ